MGDLFAASNALNHASLLARVERLERLYVDLSRASWQLSCEKCGATDIGTQWHQDTFAGRGRTCSWSEQHATGQHGEHLHRYCRTCSYQWRAALIEEARNG
jgi:hypothetical protein